MQTQLPPEWLEILKSLQAPATPAWVKVLDAVSKVVQITAIIIGGVWAYYKFIKDRLYTPRLDPSVSGTTFRSGDKDFLIATISLENVGSSKIDINQEGTALRVCGCSLDVVGPGDWNWLFTLPVFVEKAWIDSAEFIQDKLLIPLPPEQMAVKMELRIVAHLHEWEATDIIKVDSEKPRIISVL